MDPTSIGVACSITGPGEGQVGGHLQFLYRSALLRHGRPCREASLTPRDADLRSDWSMTRGEKNQGDDHGNAVEMGPLAVPAALPGRGQPRVRGPAGPPWRGVGRLG